MSEGSKRQSGGGGVSVIETRTKCRKERAIKSPKNPKFGIQNVIEIATKPVDSQKSFQAFAIFMIMLESIKKENCVEQTTTKPKLKQLNFFRSHSGIFCHFELQILSN